MAATGSSADFDGGFSMKGAQLPQFAPHTGYALSLSVRSPRSIAISRGGANVVSLALPMRGVGGAGLCRA
jgi:hypothetical protein